MVYNDGMNSCQSDVYNMIPCMKLWRCLLVVIIFTSCHQAEGEPISVSLLAPSNHTNTFRYGEDVSLQCIPSNLNATNTTLIQTMYWTLNNQVLMFANKTNGTFEITMGFGMFNSRITGDVDNNTIAYLTITNLIGEYSGVIYCSMKLENSSFLQVGFPHTFTPEKSIKTIGSNMTMDCVNQQLTSSDSLIWYKDNVRITFKGYVVDTYIQHYKVDASGRLFLLNITASNVGVYRCVVNTKWIRSYEVRLPDPPPPTATTEAPFVIPTNLLGGRGYAVGVSIGLFIIFVIIITMFIQRHFPVPGYTGGPIEAIMAFLSCSKKERKI